jgi:Tol biopolymer transport system component
MLLRYVFIFSLLLGLCAGTEAQQSPFAPHVTTFRAIVRDFDETSGGYSPAWSPDGRLIAYLAASDNSLWVMVMDAQNPNRVARNVRVSPQNSSQTSFGLNQSRIIPRWFREMRHVDWSPVAENGNHRIAFVGNDGGLWMVEGDVTATPMKAQVTPLVRSEDTQTPRLFAPRWSPDGKRIAFVKHQPSRRESSLWLLTLATRKVREIFPGNVVGEPVWAPNGKWLTCTVREREEGKPPRWDIWRISAEGEEPLPLTKEGMCSMPRWSPDGKRMAYVCTMPPPVEQDKELLKIAFFLEPWRGPAAAVHVRTDKGLEFNLSALYVINADGTQRTSLTETTVRASAAVNEAFEKVRAEFSAKNSAGGNSSDGSARRMLFQTVVPIAAREIHLDTEPAWSSDSKRLAFVRVNFAVKPGVERRCVWTIDVDTKKAEPLTVGGGESAPLWSPQGARLLVLTKRLLGLEQRESGAGPPPRVRIERLESLPEIWLVDLGSGNPPK